MNTTNSSTPAEAMHEAIRIPFLEAAVFLVLGFAAVAIIWSYRNVSNRHEKYRETGDQVRAAVERYESLYEKDNKR